MRQLLPQLRICFKLTGNCSSAWGGQSEAWPTLQSLRQETCGQRWARRESAFAPYGMGLLHIHIGAERIVLDEFAARLDHVAHQLGEDVVGLVNLLDLHL